MKNILYQESIVEIKHLFRMMRNTLLALFVFAGTAFATESYSQTMKVTVVADNVSTGKVISEIEKQTDYLFVYNVNEVNLKRNVKVNAQNKSVAEVLNKVFEGTDIYYAMEGKNIMLMSKAKDGEAVQQANKVTGIVKDANGEPVIGANVMVKGQSIGTITDIDGRFVLDAPKDAVLQITYIGFTSQDVKIGNKKEIVVTQGTPCNKLYVLLEGKLRTDIIDGLGNEVMIEYIIAPRTFATPHLFNSNNTLPATFTALEDSVVLMATKDSTFKVISQDPQVLHNFLCIAGNCNICTVSRLKPLSRKTVRERFIVYLFEHKKKDSLIVEIMHTQSQLAEYLNVSRPALSKEINKIIKEGLITMEGKKIEILNKMALEKYL